MGVEQPYGVEGEVAVGSWELKIMGSISLSRAAAFLPTGFISGVHLWLIKVVNLSEPDSIFIGVCRGCMPLDQVRHVYHSGYAYPARRIGWPVFSWF